MTPMLGQNLMKSIRTIVLAGIAAAPLLTPGPVAADTITVVLDRAKVMRVSRPADIVIVGNPAIADAAIQDTQTLVITGRSYGTTNLIVLDAAGQAIADEVVVVAAPNEQVVTVYRRAAQQTYSCTPVCSPTLTVGDQNGAFQALNEQIQAKDAATAQAADR